jgi:hypothetical protein
MRDHPPILVKCGHGVQLWHLLLNIDCGFSLSSMSLLCYSNISMHCFYSSMFLHTGCLFGSMLIYRKFVDAHAPSMMIVVSLSSVGGNIEKPWLLVLL